MKVAESAQEFLSAGEAEQIDAWWRACNYLSAGMIYLHENPLLRVPLQPGHIKQRLLGHWGSDAGQSFIWVHLNRLIRKLDLNMIYISGPGHGAPATSWNSNKFLNPIRDGAVLPILHLNGYKIANPTILARISPEELDALFRGYGYTPYVVEGSDPAAMHQKMAATLEQCVTEIRKIQSEAPASGKAERPRWPMIILRSPKGWTGPQEIDGHEDEDFCRAHQVPLTDVAEKPAHLQLLEEWLRSYKPEELFDAKGAPVAAIRALAPAGQRRMSANPHANGGLLRKPRELPPLRHYAGQHPQPRTLQA